MWHIPAFAFLPPSEIPAAFYELKIHIPVETHDIIQNGTLVWFEPSFSSNFWSVSENIEFAYPRTQNTIEG
ncbi:4545_t:CDS:2 [Gigaspora rosea]|nr:4545_t:CDS:2 [Gigaspora rosea]